MLYGFGDSFTQGCYEGILLSYPYGSILAKKLGEQYTNKARYGMSFEDINATITKHLQFIKKGDMVIVGGTTVNRIMFPVPYHQIAEYHGTYPPGVKSITGVNSPTLDFFFDDLHIRKDKMKEMGYNFTKEEYGKLIADYTHLLKGPFHDTYMRFYEDWFKHWEAYFTVIGVPFYWWHCTWWNKAPKEHIGTCGHWDQEYHEEFADMLYEFIQNNPSGCFESTSII